MPEEHPPATASETQHERGPDGDRSYEAVAHRFSLALDHAMETQRAIRKVLPDPVDRRIVVRCIELALKAPTGSNGQNWEFVVVEDEATKARLQAQYAKAWRLYSAIGRRVRQDEGTRRIMGAVQWQVDNFTTYPVVVVPCLRAEATNARPPFVPRPPVGEASWYGSIFPSVQNLLLAARSVGLGASLTTLPLWSNTAIRRILGLPLSVQPVCVVPMGWPRGRYGPTTRKPVGEVVHLDRYGQRLGSLGGGGGTGS